MRDGTDDPQPRDQQRAECADGQYYAARGCRFAIITEERRRRRRRARLRADPGALSTRRGCRVGAASPTPSAKGARCSCS
ncbi:MAG: hypothetical protein MZW92_44350 [Comamonadaceae bacterium]|nr:hypothetical protein [Comamonadaceae bacterium]